jgi:hypothetical protein
MFTREMQSQARSQGWDVGDGNRIIAYDHRKFHSNDLAKAFVEGRASMNDPVAQAALTPAGELATVDQSFLGVFAYLNTRPADALRKSAKKQVWSLLRSLYNLPQEKLHVDDNTGVVQTKAYRRQAGQAA